MSENVQEWFDTLDSMVDCASDRLKPEIRYRFLYSYAVAEIDIIRELKEHDDITGDYKLVEALAGLYAVMEYSATQLAAYANETDC